ncbi:MAG: hypothetical protein K9N23_23200, partial [Akkermansiaceae bacterium]|nr:hypothetical protein [Akkermansiaceae bacterium]
MRPYKGIGSIPKPTISIDPFDNTPISPPPSAPPKAPFVHRPETLREAKTIQQGGRAVTLQRIDPLPVPPPPEPAKPPTAEERAAFAARSAAFRATHPRENLLMLGGTLYLSESHPPRAFVRHWPSGGGEAVSFWTNIDLRELRSVDRFIDSAGRRHQLFMLWSIIRTDRISAAWAAKGHAWQPPAFPTFPGETPTGAGQPATLSGPASFIPTPDSPADPALLATVGELHKLYNNERPRLHAAYLTRENARLAREAELKANPPRPQDITIHYWLKTTSPEGPNPTRAPK